MEAMKLQGVTPKPGTPAEAAALIDSEMQKWSDRDQGDRPQGRE